MNFMKLLSWFHRGAAKLGAIIASSVLPAEEFVMPTKTPIPRTGVLPLRKGELAVNNIYLHVIVVPHTYELRVSEFTPLCKPETSSHPFMPRLEGFLARDFATGKIDFLYVEPLGLVPDKRENFHRVFLATKEARSVIDSLVQQNDLRAYFFLIKETYSWEELALIKEDEVYEKIASWLP